MTVTRVQKRYITYEITFEQKEMNLEVLTDGNEEWQVVDMPDIYPFNLFDWVTQEQIDAECTPDI